MSETKPTIVAKNLRSIAVNLSSKQQICLREAADLLDKQLSQIDWLTARVKELENSSSGETK
jgi:predicted HTH domain antitoxin